MSLQMSVEKKIWTQSDRDLYSSYIAIEGSDGVGKTTWIKKFAEWLRQNGHQDVLAIREPGTGLVGEYLRDKILSKEISLDQQIQFFIANRIVLQETIIKKALTEGTTVLTDRSVVSSLVFQGLMNDYFDEVMEAHQSLPSFIFPDITIFCQAPFSVVLERLRDRGTKELLNWLDTQGEKLHQRRHQFFADAASWYPYPHFFLDLTKPFEETAQEAYEQIKLLKGKQ